MRIARPAAFLLVIAHPARPCRARVLRKPPLCFYAGLPKGLEASRVLGDVDHFQPSVNPQTRNVASRTGERSNRPRFRS